MSAVDLKEVIVPTYGRMTHIKDHDDLIEDKMFEEAEHHLHVFNRKLLFMKEDFVMCVAMSYYKRKAQKFSITHAKRS